MNDHALARLFELDPEEDPPCDHGYPALPDGAQAVLATLVLLAGDRERNAAFALAELVSRRGLERPCKTLVGWAPLCGEEYDLGLLMRPLLVFGVAVLAMTGCGGDDSSTGAAGQTSTVIETQEEPPTVDDQRRAESALLGAADFGDGWTSYDVGADQIVSREASCLRFDDGQLVETAQALGDVFTEGPPILLTAGKVFSRASHVATSSARLYETEADAEMAFDRIVASVRGRPLFYCLVRANTVRKGPRIVGAQTYYFPVGRFPRIAEQQWDRPSADVN